MLTRCFTPCLALLVVASTGLADWKPADGPLRTRWAKDVTPDKAHPEYPRPQLVREKWLNLNGLWDYAVCRRDLDRPEKWDGQILVPFPIESALSGVMKRVSPDERLWYRKIVELPQDWNGQRVLLHIGACDWETTVWVNGAPVGDHRGGYDPFSFDITSALRPAGKNEILVAVWDPTDTGYQPRGKQIRNPHGIWYTPVTGIWRTVWLEPVPTVSITRLKLTPDVDNGKLLIATETTWGNGDAIRVVIKDGGQQIASSEARPGVPFPVDIPNVKLWSPDAPFLYDVEVSLQSGGKAIDTVRSYAGMRKISMAKDEHGTLRLFLNNKPLFQYGPLDQGFWPDGIYTAPTDEALRYDIEMTKKLGCNMARKHVKVEPDRWYYWCDKLGLLVWQDMPSGDRYIRPNDKDIQRVAQSARQFERELKANMDALYNHPCIVMWVPFNEGWGQYDTPRITDWIKHYDPSRLVNNTSGWSDRGVGDVYDIHVYPGPGAPKTDGKRASVLGEFGGLGLPLSGHTWQAEKNWGYKSFKTREELTAAYLDLLEKLRPLIDSQGLAAAVYTQTTDVEIEVNGLMTYDREVIKMPAEKIAEAARRLYAPPK